MSLRELYQEIIVDHGKNPRHFGVLPNATHFKVGHNPLCGDKLTVYVSEQNGIVDAVQFEGSGCAISVASASLMAEAVRGKSIASINELFDQFHELVTTGKEPDSDVGKLAALAGVSQFPIRVKCATLAWHTLKSAFDNNIESVSTE